MLVQKLSDNVYCLNNMDISDLKTLRNMINGASIIEKRHWYPLLEDIDREISKASLT